MPVILDDDWVDEWLDSDVEQAEPLEHPYSPVEDDGIEYHPVTKAVGNTQNNNPENIEPIDAA